MDALNGVEHQSGEAQRAFHVLREHHAETQGCFAVFQEGKVAVTLAYPHQILGERVAQAATGRNRVADGLVGLHHLIENHPFDAFRVGLFFGHRGIGDLFFPHFAGLGIFLFQCLGIFEMSGQFFRSPEIVVSCPPVHFTQHGQVGFVGRDAHVLHDRQQREWMDEPFQRGHLVEHIGKFQAVDERFECRAGRSRDVVHRHFAQETVIVPVLGLFSGDAGQVEQVVARAEPHMVAHQCGGFRGDGADDESGVQAVQFGREPLQLFREKLFGRHRLGGLHQSPVAGKVEGVGCREVCQRPGVPPHGHEVAPLQVPLILRPASPVEVEGERVARLHVERHHAFVVDDYHAHHGMRQGDFGAETPVRFHFRKHGALVHARGEEVVFQLQQEVGESRLRPVAIDEALHDGGVGAEKSGFVEMRRVSRRDAGTQLGLSAQDFMPVAVCGQSQRAVLA